MPARYLRARKLCCSQDLAGHPPRRALEEPLAAPGGGGVALEVPGHLAGHVDEPAGAALPRSHGYLPGAQVDVAPPEHARLAVPHPRRVEQPDDARQHQALGVPRARRGRGHGVRRADERGHLGAGVDVGDVVDLAGRHAARNHEGRRAPPGHRLREGANRRYPPGLGVGVLALAPLGPCHGHLPCETLLAREALGAHRFERREVPGRLDVGEPERAPLLDERPDVAREPASQPAHHRTPPSGRSRQHARSPSASIAA